MFTNNTEELAQNKLILLYIINNSSTPLTNEGITEFIMENNYMNYFLVQQYLLELEESKLIDYIDEDKDKGYILSDKGNTTLFYFKDRINNNIKDDIASKLIKNKNLAQDSTQITGEYAKKDNNTYIVDLTLMEEGKSLLHLSLTVPTVEQAKSICNTWKDNTEYICQTLFTALENDKKFSSEK